MRPKRLNPVPFFVLTLGGLFGVVFNLVVRGTYWQVQVVLATMAFAAGANGLILWSRGSRESSHLPAEPDAEAGRQARR